MEPTFIISFDCEGKWGMADCLTPAMEARLTNQQLLAAYQSLVDLLDRREVRATFGFVGLFTIHREEWKATSEWVGDGLHDPDYLAAFHAADQREDYDGWFAPETAELICQRPEHEFAAHGLGHCLANGTEPIDNFRDELRILRKFRLFDRENLTFIYPRNLVAHPRALADEGYIGYRECLPQVSGPVGRVANLLKEFNLGTSSQPHSVGAKAGDPNTIPSGYFLNWRSGPRAKIPVSVTVKRWKNIIDRAIERGEVAHLWTHPHNFIGASGMFEQFDAILAYAAERVRGGDLKNQTMRDYALAVSRQAG